ncbi:RmlC-like cupin domain-containing protein [Geopyxis carbonaria]|nr:RmlC-like cupin domain-containing protein [Geopyxis carbonaria]
MAVRRNIKKAFMAVEKSEGAGAKVRRSIGTQQLKSLSPFLMLDHFSVGIGAGFPDHPHRGQETITYLLHGSVQHEDFAGNKGTIYAGDLQFMTAGRGIVHAEMPGKNEDGSPNIGLQLWVDLPKELKYCEPRYRDLRGEEIPTIRTDEDRVEIKIISGNSHGIDSLKDLAYTPVWILDVTVKPGGTLKQPLPVGWNAFAYTLEGEIIFGESTNVGAFYNVVFEQNGDFIEAIVPHNVEKNARFVIIAGQPHDQPIIQYGPFVCSSSEEVYQAMLDYQSHSNGFERAKNWQSEIGKTILR